MNSKTTILLAVFLVVMVGGYFGMQQFTDKPSPIKEEPTFKPDPVSKRLVEEDTLGDIVKITLLKAGAPEPWVFVKEEGQKHAKPGDEVWHITQPVQSSVMSWEAGKFKNRLYDATYTIAITPGEKGGMTLAKAGLEPPAATITLEDGDGKSVAFDLGNRVTSRESYVRVHGEDKFQIVSVTIDQLVKDKALDYKDTRLWDVLPQDVTRISFDMHADEASSATDDEAQTRSLVFERRSGQWMMTQPIEVEASQKVPDAVSLLCNLRAVKWYERSPENLVTYGLQPPKVTIRMTAASAEGDAGDAPTKPDEYVLKLSALSPIAQDTSVFMQPGADAAVGVIAKTDADKLTPGMNGWRDMSVVGKKSQQANRIDISTAGGSMSLQRKNGMWRFEGSEHRVDQKAVRDTLQALGSLQASAFVKVGDNSLAEYGFAEPVLHMALDVPGEVGLVDIKVGNYTSEKLKRLRYVSVNDGPYIAKVQTDKVKLLMKEVDDYRNKSILSLFTDRIGSVVIDRKSGFVEGRETVTLHKGDDGFWYMARPGGESASETAGGDLHVDQTKVKSLAGGLATLFAKSFLPASASPDSYGLSPPKVIVTLDYTPRKEVQQVGVEDAEDPDQPGKITVKEVQPPNKSYTVHLGERKGKWYAYVPADGPQIYEIPASVGQAALAEFRPDLLFTFNDAQVAQFTIRDGDLSHAFSRNQAGEWQYADEPDWSIDSARVKALLLNIKDLRTYRYVAYDATDLEPFGLLDPQYQVTVMMKDGTVHRLDVAPKFCSGDPQQGLYARLDAGSTVFLLTGSSVSRFQVKLDELEASRE